MFLKRLWAEDPRFKCLVFHEGMNLVLADKAENAVSTDSRNGAGKSSIIRILRYLLGGRSTDWIKGLANYTEDEFLAEVVVDGVSHRIGRSPTNSEVSYDNATLGVTEWRRCLGRDLLGFVVGQSKPTSGEVVAHLIRDYFNDPVKTGPHESDQAAGARVGYYLGLSEEALSKSAQAASFEANKKALNKAVKEGALGDLGPDEAECRSDLAAAESRRLMLEDKLSRFEVDENYLDHQARADDLSRSIATLNDRNVVLRRAIREFSDAIQDESGEFERYTSGSRLARLYREVGSILPDVVLSSFQDVVEFHRSVVRNRRLFLEEELRDAYSELEENKLKLEHLDKERANVLLLLKSSMALDSFLRAQADLSELDAQISRLNNRLEDFKRLKALDSTLKRMRLEAEDAVRDELGENDKTLGKASALFVSLSEEIYSDRKARLLFDVTSKGVLKVVPKIDGDDSKGIKEVSIFLFDFVCVILGSEQGRIPAFLVHDSHLFDAMDDRQLTSCLNIGARLSRENHIQYIVMINTDRLEAAEGIGFDREGFPIDMILTDKGDAGGLFGVRFG